MNNRDEVKAKVLTAICEIEDNDIFLNHVLDLLHAYFRERKPDTLDPTNEDVQLLTHALAVVKGNYSDPDFGVEELAAQLNMHRTNLYRRLRRACSDTPIHIIRNVRMEKAYALLSQGQVYVSQVAYRVGYRSPKNFALHFKQYFGIYPHQVAVEQPPTHHSEE